MKYFTKEWYSLMQRSDMMEGFSKVPDGKYTKKDIEKLYDKKLRKELRAEKKAYDTAPDLGFLLDILDGEDFDPSDWVLEDEATGKARMPKDREEVRSFILAEQEAAAEEFTARPPFDEEDYRQMFDDIYRERVADLKRWPLSGALGKADRRLIALEMVPETIYKEAKEEERAARKEYNRINRNAERALSRQSVPEYIWEGLHLHDCEVLSIRKKGRNTEMVFNIEGMEEEGETPFRKLIFKGSKILEREDGIRIRTYRHEDCCGEDDCGCGEEHHHHHHHHDDCVHSDCVFTACEIYSRKDGYEAHMMLALPSGLRYLTISAADIEVINNAEFSRESAER
ncbi:MAG: hypothetical protein IKX89_05675 [Firmicutes bacterium]|nr:hypothetical protein [Bacillota bacterium]